MMTDWSVEVEAAGAVGQVLDEDCADELAVALSQDAAAVAYLPGRYSVRLNIQADDIHEAVEQAVERVCAAAQKSGLPSWPFVRVTALSADELDRDLTRPAIPVLLGVAELAGLLGVTRQRASDLAKTSSFPRPIAVLASGPVWAESTVKRYIPTWTRRPGRPKAP
jgi:hypothetical protein